MAADAKTELTPMHPGNGTAQGEPHAGAGP